VLSFVEERSSAEPFDILRQSSAQVLRINSSGSMAPPRVFGVSGLLGCPLIDIKKASSA